MRRDLRERNEVAGLPRKDLSGGTRSSHAEGLIGQKCLVTPFRTRGRGRSEVPWISEDVEDY